MMMHIASYSQISKQIIYFAEVIIIPIAHCKKVWHHKSTKIIHSNHIKLKISNWIHKKYHLRRFYCYYLIELYIYIQPQHFSITFFVHCRYDSFWLDCDPKKNCFFFAWSLQKLSKIVRKNVHFLHTKMIKLLIWPILIPYKQRSRAQPNLKISNTKNSIKIAWIV